MSMQATLVQLGLGPKEAATYMFLLENGNSKASHISKELGETRTNTYMILDRLMTHGLVEIASDSSIREYIAANPEKLKLLIANQQQELRKAQAAIHGILPELSSQYNLGRNKPGVVYLEGISGYKKSLDDMAKSGHMVSVIASSVAHENPEAWAALQRYALGRKRDGAHSRIIFSNDVEPEIDPREFQMRGYELRFWGEQSHEAEIAIYGNKIALSVYSPKLIVTVITNNILAQTFAAIFEQLWGQARRVRLE